MSLRKISEYVADDNTRLSELFKVYRSMPSGAAGKKTDLLHAYMAGLRRHVEWEEKILFPLLEQRLGFEGRGPTAGLREEHRRIESLIESIHGNVVRNNRPANDAEASLARILNDHNETARAGLYSMLDSSLDEIEKFNTYKRMKETPLPKGNPCCDGSAGSRSLRGSSP